MARYDYRCEDCGTTFEIQERISEHEADASPECPECGSRETRQQMSDFFPDTSDKTI
jgi:putative FmdB family regulatory protein